jgi:hypothetical protein
MVENKDSTAAHFTPSEAELSIIQTHLSLEAIVDKGYQATVLLKKEQAEKRKELKPLRRKIEFKKTNELFARSIFKFLKYLKHLKAFNH